MSTHPYIRAALMADRQKALHAEAHTASLIRQARRANRTPPGGRRLAISGAHRAIGRMLLLTLFRGTQTIELTTPARDVFDLLIDVDRLPEWNAQIHHVITHPGHPLRAGDDWVVHMVAMGRQWPTRSRAIVVDPVALRFEHRSCTDDGNPSHAYWIWQVVTTPGGSRLTVAWYGYPRTFWRQLLLARVRRPVLAREVRASLAEIDTVSVASAGRCRRCSRRTVRIPAQPARSRR